MDIIYPGFFVFWTLQLGSSARSIPGPRCGASIGLILRSELREQH
jgi:hypothetical protein